MFSVFLSETLVFRTNEYSRNKVSSNKETKKQVMQNLVLASLEDRQANKSNSANNSKNHGQNTKDLFAEGDVGYETTVVA